MEQTGCEITSGAPMTLAAKGQMVMVMCAGLSRRSSGGEFLLHAPIWNLSVGLKGGGSVLQGRCWNLPHRSSGGKTLLRVGLGVSPTPPLLESFSSFSCWAVCLTRPVLKSV